MATDVLPLAVPATVVDLRPHGRPNGNLGKTMGTLDPGQSRWKMEICGEKHGVRRISCDFHGCVSVR